MCECSLHTCEVLTSRSPLFGGPPASYSARGTYSPVDDEGMKRIFMCRLAIGAHTAVQKGYNDREPPVRDAERLLGVGTLRYDTTTDSSPAKDGVPGEKSEI